VREGEEIVVRDADGRELLRRPLSPLERANDQFGIAQQVHGESRIHAPCASRPINRGVCNMRFPDGQYWCFTCNVAWRPDEVEP
jgi:hypothetical protein